MSSTNDTSDSDGEYPAVQGVCIQLFCVVGAHSRMFTATLDPRIDFFAGTVAGACILRGWMFVCQWKLIPSHVCTRPHPGMAALTVGQPFDTGSFSRVYFRK